MVMSSLASSNPPHLLLLLYAGCFLLSLPLDAPLRVASAAATAGSPPSFSFDFTNASTYDIEDLRFESNASVHGGLVDLTCDTQREALTGCAGRMSYAHPVPFYDNATGEVASFTTRFTFSISIKFPNRAVRKGDGMAFFLAGYPSTIPPGSAGGSLGLITGGERTAYGTDRFVAVEFDTYNNTLDNSSTYDHIAIDINSVWDPVNRTILDSFSLNGTMTASVSFNSSTRMMVAGLHFDDNPSMKPVEVSAKLPDPVTSLLPQEVAVGFSAATGTSVELHQIRSWSFNSTLAPKKRRGHGIIVTVSIGGAAVFLVAVWFILAWFWWKHRRDSFVAGAGPRRFRYRDLANATDNFSEERKLGEGAFGAVYKGTSLKDQGGQQQQEVAVKKMFKGSGGGTKDFFAEVNTISETRHKNLVRLKGWCCSGSSSNLIGFMCWWCRPKQNDDIKLFLVYELVPNGNLHEHLHKRETVLPWPTRYKLVKGIGSALVYLHHECRPYILHRDIKPSNILLDDDFNAKLADFGLSRIADHNNATLLTTAIGTVGYMDPQCKRDGEVKFNRSSDVYSFGIVLLEIACTGKSREQVWDLYASSRSSTALIMEAAADGRLGGEFDRGQMERVLVLGLWCSLPDGAKRPSMLQAMRVLEHDAPLPDLAPSRTC